ncbi:hypothetical protein B566_EDAN009464, partial [Ephemera danica]
MMWHQLVLVVILASCLILVTEAARENASRRGKKRMKSTDNSTIQESDRGFRRKLRRKQTVSGTYLTTPTELNVNDVTPSNAPENIQGGNTERPRSRNWKQDWPKSRYGGQGDSSGSNNDGDDQKGK